MSDTRKNDLFCGDLFADDMLDCENSKIDDNVNNNADNNLYNQNKDLFFTLIDASGFIFRAFYAMKMLNSPDGVPVNAVYGYCSMLLRIIEEKLNGEDVHHQEVILPVFDSARKNFRMDLYDNYKEIFLFNKTKLVCLDNGYVGPSVAKMVIDSGKEILLPYKRPMTKDGFFRKQEYVYDELYDNMPKQ